MSRSGPRPGAQIPLGIDIADGMVALARRNHPELEFSVGDAEDLPLEDGGFDAVVGNFVINHLPQPDRGLAEAARVLVAGGHLAFSVWQRPDRMLVMGLIAEAIETAGVEEDDEPPGSLPGRTATGSPTRPSSVGCSRAPATSRWRTSPSSPSSSCIGSRTPRSSRRALHGREIRACRGSTFVRAQSDAVQAGIRKALDAVVGPYRAGDVLEVPVAANIASGRKP